MQASFNQTDLMTNSLGSENFPKSLGAIILVGGQSLRMGRDKSQLPLGDRTFLHEIVRKIAPAVGRIVVVGNATQDLDKAARELKTKQPTVEISFVTDQEPNRGPLEGIRVGLKHLEPLCSHAFVTGCDVPLIKPEFVQFLFDRIDNSTAIVPCSEDGKVFGMSAIYTTNLHPEIGDLIERNELRVSNLAKRFSAKRIWVDELRTIDPKLDSLMNINRVEDYENLLRKIADEDR